MVRGLALILAMCAPVLGAAASAKPALGVAVGPALALTDQNGEIASLSASCDHSPANDVQLSVSRRRLGRATRNNANEGLHAAGLLSQPLRSHGQLAYSPLDAQPFASGATTILNLSRGYRASLLTNPDARSIAATSANWSAWAAEPDIKNPSVPLDVIAITVSPDPDPPATTAETAAGLLVKTPTSFFDRTAPNDPAQIVNASIVGDIA